MIVILKSPCLTISTLFLSECISIIFYLLKSETNLIVLLVCILRTSSLNFIVGWRMLDDLHISMFANGSWRIHVDTQTNSGTKYFLIGWSIFINCTTQMTYMNALIIWKWSFFYLRVIQFDMDNKHLPVIIIELFHYSLSLLCFDVNLWSWKRL